MGSFLEKSKYLSVIGVVSLLLASAAAFAWGAIKTWHTLALIIQSVGKDEFIPVALIELVDSFLIATALLIFSIGLFELFIHDLDLPAWIEVHNLHELKGKLSGVIVLVMVVKFLEHLVEWKDAMDSLYFAIAVAVVSGALIALNHFGGKE